MTHIRSLLMLSALVFLASAALARRPNVIFFFIDDLGWSDLGCYGSTFHDTPHIDSLAQGGQRFSDAYATCHVCSPSRASVLTGKYPARLKLTDWIPGRREFSFQAFQNAANLCALPLGEVTLAEALKKHGYTTAHVGKWHLGEDGNGPLQQGFDIQVPQNWFKGWPRTGYHAPFKLDGLPAKDGDYLTDRLTDQAIRFIRDHKSKPFFLYLSHFAVHDPIQGRSDLVEKYEKRRHQLPACKTPFILESNPDDPDPLNRAQLEEMAQTPDFSKFEVLPKRTVKIKQRQDNPAFAAMVESVDESVGRVLATLKELDLKDDTIIIFTSDNGGMSAANFGDPKRVIAPDKVDMAYATSNLPLRGAKGWLYEGGIRVPLIISCPGRGNPGAVISTPVIGADLYPTIIELLNLPDAPKQHVDGLSLAKLLSAGYELKRDALYWHFPHYSNHGMQSPGGAVREGRYKLIEYFENGSIQLFDLQSDIGEQHDLSKKKPELAQSLKLKLHQWREQVGADMIKAKKPK